MTDELQQVRKEVSKTRETIDTLRGQLTAVQDELERMRTVEAELNVLQAKQSDLISEPNQVKTEMSVAESNWQTEREALQAEYETALTQAEQSAAISAQIDAQVHTSANVERESELELELAKYSRTASQYIDRS